MGLFHYLKKKREQKEKDEHCKSETLRLAKIYDILLNSYAYVVHSLNNPSNYDFGDDTLSIHMEYEAEKSDKETKVICDRKTKVLKDKYQSDLIDLQNGASLLAEEGIDDYTAKRIKKMLEFISGKKSLQEHSEEITCYVITGGKLPEDEEI